MNYTDFLDNVQPDVPGAGQAMLVQAIRQAAREFCERTRRYEHEPAAANIVALTHTYTITAPTGTEVADILKAFVNGKEIYPKGKAALDELITDWRTTATGLPEYFYVPGLNKIRLVKTPSEASAAGLTLEVALRPTLASTACDDTILAVHHEAIAHGAKARLFAMQKKPWTNPGLATYHMNEFNAECGRGDSQTAKSGTRAPLRTRAYYR